MDTRQKINFFIFAHNIRFGKLLREKIVLVSSILFYGRKFEKFEKCTSGLVSTLQNSGITSSRNFEKAVKGLK